MTDHITLPRAVVENVLAVLEEATYYTSCTRWSPSMTDECKAATTVLRAALAEPEPQNQSEESLDMVKANRCWSLQSAAYLALDELYCGEAPPNARQQAAAEALRAALAEPEQVRDQSDFGTWFCRLGKLADAYYETGRTHPARHKARGELMAHALNAAIGWRARSVLEQQQSARDIKEAK